MSLLAYQLLEQSLKTQQHWQQVSAEISLKIRQSIDLADILNTAVSEIKQCLNCGRVIVYQFDDNWQGTVVTEAVDPQWRVALGAQIIDTCMEMASPQSIIKLFSRSLEPSTLLIRPMVQGLDWRSSKRSSNFKVGRLPWSQPLAKEPPFGSPGLLDLCEILGYRSAIYQISYSFR